MSLPICPCQVLNDTTAKKLYTECCQPLHEGIEVAKNAEQLMRSRYSAFVLVLADYIVATTLPAQQKFLDKSAIKDWARQTKWAGLEVIKHTPKLGKHHAQVEFKAFYNTDEGVKAHCELSAFVEVRSRIENSNTAKQDGLWYFLDPTVAMKLTQKQPCICGSGQKFKRCCGQFLPV